MTGKNSLRKSRRERFAQGLAVARSGSPSDRSTRPEAVTVESWEFTCPRCQIDFMAPEQQFVFQSVPKEWLLAGIQAA